MKPCSCGRITEVPVPIGIQYGVMDEFGVWQWDWPALILWNCPCGTNRAARFEDVSPALRRAAMLADMALRPDSPEMMG